MHFHLEEVFSSIQRYMACVTKARTFSPFSFLHPNPLIRPWQRFCVFLHKFGYTANINTGCWTWHCFYPFHLSPLTLQQRLCFLVYGTHSEFYVQRLRGECCGTLEDTPRMTACEGLLPPLGSLLPTLLIILPFHPMPRLNPWETSGPLSHTRLLRLHPHPHHHHTALLHLLQALQISLCSVRVCVYVHAHIIFFLPFSFFFCWGLIRITITGMQFESRSLPAA